MATMTGRYCRYCCRKVLAVPDTPDMLVSALLLLVTCGFYFPILIWRLNYNNPYRCMRCGERI